MLIIGIVLILMGMFIGGLSYVWYVKNSGYPKDSSYFLGLFFIIISITLGIIFAIIKIYTFLKLGGILN